MFVDTHAHLTDEKFDTDRLQVIEMAKTAGVEIIVTSGANLSTSQKAVELARKEADIFASVGVHPQDAEEFDADVLAALEKLAQDKKVCAIGEIGLEFLDGCPDVELQKRVFLQQLQLAHRLFKPVVIHTRNAIGQTMQILQENRNLLDAGGTLHCFSESLEVAREAIKLGLNISVGGVSTFTNAKRLQQVIAEVPLSAIILETDCPYLAPTPMRGQRNEPSYIPLIAQNLALLHGIDVGEVERVTTQNARRLFNI